MAKSYNGWTASSDPNAIGINKNFAVHGAKFPGGMKSGDVSTLFTYLINALHTRVEPMMVEGGKIGYGCWGYSYRANVNNPSTLSCHASGTAIDYNAPKHPNGTRTGPNGGGGWTGAQYNTIQIILRECSGAIRWLSGNDPMHFEIYGSTTQVANAVKRLSITIPDGDDDMPLTDADYDNIAARVWSRIITQGDGVSEAQPAWAWLVQTSNAAEGASPEVRPAVLNGQSRDEALAQTRNTVRDIQEEMRQNG